MRPRLPVVLLLISTCAFAQSAHRINKIVSAASGAPTIAPNSIATIYGENLTDRTESAGSLPLPTQLAGISVVIFGSNVSTGAQLLLASPTQINFIVPGDVPVGMDSISVVGPEIIFATSSATVSNVAPAIFSADGSGSGPAAAIAIRTVLPTRIQSLVNVFVCDPAATPCHALPLNLGVDTPLTLVLFGTGIRGGAKVTAAIGGQTVPVEYAGSQSQYPGLDQVNIPLQLGLRGAGLVDVVITVDGQPSNAVQVSIQ